MLTELVYMRSLAPFSSRAVQYFQTASTEAPTVIVIVAEDPRVSASVIKDGIGERRAAGVG